MVSASEVILNYVCPTLGCVFANMMFTAPYHSVKEAMIRGNLGELNPTPWAFMLGNCIGWATYSLVIKNPFVFWSAAPGIIPALIFNFCAVKLQYQEHVTREIHMSFMDYLDKHDGPDASADKEDQLNGDTKKLDWAEILPQLLPSNTNAPTPHEKMVVAVMTMWLTIISLVFLLPIGPGSREAILGTACNLGLLFFYGAPLSTISSVLQARDASAIHIGTMVTNTANGLFWAAYAIATWQPVILLPNGIGAILGAIQGLLVFTFPRREPVIIEHLVHNGEEKIIIMPVAEESSPLLFRAKSSFGAPDPVDTDKESGPLLSRTKSSWYGSPGRTSIDEESGLNRVVEVNMEDMISAIVGNAAEYVMDTAALILPQPMAHTD